MGKDLAVFRQDPSNVIRVGGLYYAWYTRYPATTDWRDAYAATIFYATSTDGYRWTEQGESLGKGAPGAWDSHGVITPYVVPTPEGYYLFYTGTGDDVPWDAQVTKRHFGVAFSTDPKGPWKRLGNEPILSPGGTGTWDSLTVDDAHILVRDGKFWLYYKGVAPGVPPDGTQWGLAIADRVTGPYVKHPGNPILGSGHTTCLWPHRKGIAALVDNSGPERFTIQFSEDGVSFRRAAKLDFVHTGCGPYDPAAFLDVKEGPGISWGLAQVEHPEGPIGLIRFEVDAQVPERR